MAIDFLIFGLLIFSFLINLLALGAFWVTPGLRTTANRFTINLLIINLIGCVILAPTLFLSSSSSSSSSSVSGDSSSSTSTGFASGEFASAFAAQTSESDDSIELYSKPGNHQMIVRHNGQLVEQEGVILRRNLTYKESGEPRTIETIYKCNATYCQELTIDESNDALVITEIEQEQLSAEPYASAAAVPASLMPYVSVRCWSIDMAAALGALAVLLVVGDTWCAVTDPLRYHSRISGVKAWVFIALTWAMGILFGALSALRELDFESDTVLSKQKRFVARYSETYFNVASANGIFGIIFACLYFIVIILLPFGFVCGMYWRIFSEARENGLRMRQNGSSPLLQSALNLTHHQQQSSALQYTNSLCVHRNSVSSTSSHSGGGGSGGGGGLQMQIDQRKNSSACYRRDSAAKVLLPTISDDGISDVDSTTGQLLPVPEQAGSVPDRNQNILLTLQAASGEIKRNYSARQLPLLGTSSQDMLERHRLQGIRQVHSSPNLHKYSEEEQEADNHCSPHLLGHQKLQHVHSQRHPHHHFIQHQQLSGHHHHHALQIPAIQASPKALSYMSSLRHRLSNASSLFKYREESRAARISILVVITFLVSYLPYGFLVLLQSRLTAANFPQATQLAICMILIGNLSSTFIFAYRNKRVRRGVKRLFGLDMRERSLQRQSSSSGRGSGFLQRQLNGTRLNGTIKRQSSKASTHSLNSCKYLTPQSSLASNNGAVPVHTTLALRPNSSCSTFINLGLARHPTCADANGDSCAESSHIKHIPLEKDHQQQQQQQLHYGKRVTRPVLQRGITIDEQLPLDSKYAPKRNFFKLFFQSSKNLSCAAAQSCAADIEAEPTEV